MFSVYFIDNEHRERSVQVLDRSKKYAPTAATLGKPVKLINAIMTPNISEIEIHVNRRSIREINPGPLPFKRKLFSEETASTSVAEMNIKDFKEP